MVKKLMNSPHLDKYLILLADFVSLRIEGSGFERQFLQIHRTDPSDYSENVHKIISILFSEVDEYCSDSGIRNKDDLDDQGLWEKARIALVELRKIVRDPSENG